MALIALVQHLPHGLKQRYPWYIQAFNVANYTLAALAAWGAASSSALAAPSCASRSPGLAARSPDLVNHFLLAAMLRLARGHSFREAGLFSAKTVAMDLVVAALGVALAAFWR